MMRIYTRTGDQGETGLPGGARAPKDIALLEFVGTLDELNSSLGMVRGSQCPDDIDRLLAQVQHDLFAAGAEAVRRGAEQPSAPAIAAEHVALLERAIDRCDEELPALGNFILPQGVPAAAALHVARAVCRRAERRLVTVVREGRPSESGQLLPYLNRLADLLFSLARTANHRAGREEAVWRGK